MRPRVLLGVAAILVLGGGCGRDGDDAASVEASAAGEGQPVDSSQLTAAAEASLAADSYVMTVSGEMDDPGQLEWPPVDMPPGSGAATYTYQAPDRAMLRFGSGEDRMEYYVLGQDMLWPDFPVAGRYGRSDTPDHWIANNVQLPLRWLLDAEVVEVNGDTYEFRLDEEFTHRQQGDNRDGPEWPEVQFGNAQAVIADGLVQRVMLSYTVNGTDIESTFTFSHYGSAPAIEPPDSSLIVEIDEFGPTTPGCSEPSPRPREVPCSQPG